MDLHLYSFFFLLKKNAFFHFDRKALKALVRVLRNSMTSKQMAQAVLYHFIESGSSAPHILGCPQSVVFHWGATSR